MAGKTIIFDGAGQPGNLNDPGNWVGGVTPGIHDTALITRGIGAPMTGTFSVNNVMLLGKETVTFNGTLNTAGVGNCQGLMVCDEATAVFGPTGVLNDGGVMIVGNGDVGTVNVLGSGPKHGTINTNHANIGKQAAGTGTVNIDDGVWNNTANLIIGDHGGGTVRVIDGGTLSVGGNVDMGCDPGASGKLAIGTGGSVFVGGAMHLGNSASNQGQGTVGVGANSSLTVNDTLSIGTGSAMVLAGGHVTGGVSAGCIAVASGASISGHGVIGVKDGMVLDDDGTITASGGTLEIDANVAGKGTIQIGANSEALLTGSKLGLAGISFAGSNGTLALAHGVADAAPISGFTFGDFIEMAGVDAVSYNPAKETLTLSDLGVKVDTLHLVGNYAGDIFTVTQASVGALISVHPSV